MNIPSIASKNAVIVDAVNQVTARARAAIVSFSEIYDPGSYIAEGIYYYLDDNQQKVILKQWSKTMTAAEVDTLSNSIPVPEGLSETERRYHLLVWAMVMLISSEGSFGLTQTDWDIIF